MNKTGEKSHKGLAYCFFFGRQGWGCWAWRVTPLPFSRLPHSIAARSISLQSATIFPVFSSPSLPTALPSSPLPFSSPLLSLCSTVFYSPLSSSLLSHNLLPPPPPLLLLSFPLLSFSMRRSLIHLSLTPPLVSTHILFRRKGERRRKTTLVLQNPRMPRPLLLFLPLVPGGRYNKSKTLLAISLKQ